MAVTKIRGNTQIADNTIVNAQINSAAAIASSKLADTPTSAPTAGKIILRDASGRAQVANPSAAADIATKGYVDAVKTGLDVKGSARAATTAALPAHTFASNVLTASANGALPAQDGVTLVLNDRLLVKNEGGGTHLENGIYYVSQVGGAANPWKLTRTTDADESAEVTPGMYVFIEEGTANADSGWILTTNAPITLNTTALTFTQFTGAGQITAGAGLTKTGNTLAVGAGAGIQVNADSVEVIYGGAANMGVQWIGDVAVPGFIDKAARIDHRHAMFGAGTPLSSIPGAANQAGTAQTVARSDHTHGREAWATEYFLGNGTTTAFTLTYTPAYLEPLVYLNGMFQRPGTGYDYTRSGATITFASAPASGDTIGVVYLRAAP